jgi:hypothetical protein
MFVCQPANTCRSTSSFGIGFTRRRSVALRLFGGPANLRRDTAATHNSLTLRDAGGGRLVGKAGGLYFPATKGRIDMDLSRGRTVGLYRIVRKIGEGGMRAVYQAVQRSIPRAGVIKVLGSSFAEYPDASGRYRRDLDTITQLAHPHILPVYDFGEVGRSPYILVRHMTGGSLQEGRQSTHFGRADPLRLLDQMALGRDFAHAGWRLCRPT